MPTLYEESEVWLRAAGGLDPGTFRDAPPGLCG